MSQQSDTTHPLRGRVALVTGANTGIGLVTARVLAERGAHVFLACRSSERGREAAAQIRAQHSAAQVEELALDLGNFDSVKRCADTFLARDLPLHLLINNGGVASQGGLTDSGFELMFGVNHMGHFLLTQLLLERLRRSAPARIVTVASKAHLQAKGIDWNAVRARTKTFIGLKEYEISKLANVLFSAELARKLDGTGVHTYSVHPGVVASDVWRSIPWPVRSLMKLGMISVEQGALTTLHCAISPAAAAETGLYYDKSQVKEPSALALDRALSAELWQHSESWIESQLQTRGDSKPAPVDAAQASRASE